MGYLLFFVFISYALGPLLFRFPQLIVIFFIAMYLFSRSKAKKQYQQYTNSESSSTQSSQSHYSSSTKSTTTGNIKQDVIDVDYSEQDLP